MKHSTVKTWLHGAMVAAALVSFGAQAQTPITFQLNWVLPTMPYASHLISWPLP